MRRVLWSALLLLAACSQISQAPEPATAGFDISELDSSIRPADDLFAHVNGKWLAATPIPDDQVRYGTFQQMIERVETQVRTVVEETAAAPKPAGEARLIADLYRGFMDEQAIEAAGLKPLEDLFADIGSLKTHDDVWRAFGRLAVQGVESPIGLFTETDADNPDLVLAYAWQSGLGLPDRDYYFSDEPKLKAAREAYVAHIARLYVLAGWADGDVDAQKLLALETVIANHHWTPVQNRDRQRIYRNKFTLISAWEHTNGLDWRSWFAAQGYIQQGEFVLAQDTYFAALKDIVHAHDVETWKRYLRLRTLKTFASYLPKAIDAENFDFEGKTLRGQQTQRERWKRAMSLIDQLAGEPLGKLYVARYFPEASKASIRALVEELRVAYRQSIERNDWMSDVTRAAAIAKLDSFDMKLGYPDVWRDFSSLATSPTDLLGNVRRATAFEHAFAISHIGKAPDRNEWGMTPQTVNAYYRPTANEIVFPAAILQPPFFDPSADDAANYGAIGAIIGHEFSHGFDDQGRKFDGTGRLRDWWQPDDAERYEARAKRLVTQFNTYEPLPGTKINGELTLGENLADLAGVTMAFRAYMISLGGKPAPVIDGLSGEQRFFIAYAQAWRLKARDEYLRQTLLTDSHSPAEYRVTGILKNVPEFHAAFGAKDGDRLYLSPADQVRIW